MSENRWKKLLFLCLAIPFAVVPLWGCNRAGRPSYTGEPKLKVVTTLFPCYDFTRQIAGDRVEVTMVNLAAFLVFSGAGYGERMRRAGKRAEHGITGKEERQ